MTDKIASKLHFNYHRFTQYLDFIGHYGWCKLFHKQEFPRWESWRGAIVCTCGIAIDLGYAYGMHCEECYNFVRKRHEK